MTTQSTGNGEKPLLLVSDSKSGHQLSNKNVSILPTLSTNLILTTETLYKEIRKLCSYCAICIFYIHNVVDINKIVVIFSKTA